MSTPRTQISAKKQNKKTCVCFRDPTSHRLDSPPRRGKTVCSYPPPLRYFNSFYTNTFFSLSLFLAPVPRYTRLARRQTMEQTPTRIRESPYRSSRRWLTDPTLTKHFRLTSAELRARARGAGLLHGPHGKRSRAHQVSSVAQATLSDALVSHPREGGGRDAALPPCPGSSPSRSSLLPLQALLAAPFPRCPLVFPGRPPVCVCRL